VSTGPPAFRSYCDRVSESLSDYVRAVPLLGVHAFALGSALDYGSNPASRLRTWRRGGQASWVAAATAGTAGRQLLRVLATLGGCATGAQIAFQTQGLAPEVLTQELAQLEAAGLVTQGSDGSVVLAEPIPADIQGISVSLADKNVITSDRLAEIARELGISPIPTRKGDRLDAIAAVFNDPARAAQIRSELSDEAWELLARIADVGGVGVDAATQDPILEEYLTESQMFGYSFRPLGRSEKGQVLHQLTSRGLVGTGWEFDVWVWKEAWPLLNRPFFTDWPTRPAPEVAPVGEEHVRVPQLVANLDRSLQAWRVHPPSVLKNGDQRLAKSDARALAKSLGVQPRVVDLTARLAIGVGLLLANVVSESGRGRYRTVDRVWMVDPTLMEQWAHVAPVQRWLRLVAEWCQPEGQCSEQMLVNRHLLLWELANLPPGSGWSQPDEFAAWFGDRYSPMGDAGVVSECIEDLRHLGVIQPSGPLALTQLGRLALQDPKAAAEVPVGSASEVVVQADHTIIAPPDLRADLVAELSLIAQVESDAGAFIFRLDPPLITRAIQGGATEESIIGFLAEVSSVEMPSTIEWLVRDAARRANRVTVIAAPTVIAVTNPADLDTACAVKSAKLTKVSETVAVSDLPHAKVRAALDRAGLVPEVVLGGSKKPPRSQTVPQSLMPRASGEPPSGPQSALVAGEIPARLQVRGPLALTPQLVDELDR